MKYRAAAERARQADVFEQGERLKSALLDAVTYVCARRSLRSKLR
jgi:hypothetical protein